VGAFYGTHNEGDISLELDSVSFSTARKIIFFTGGRGALPKIFNSGDNQSKTN
jgi:hypothetical protein